MVNARITGKDEGSQQAVTGVGKLLQLLEPSEKGASPVPSGTTDTDVLPFAQLLQDARLVLALPRASGAAFRSRNAVPESPKEERTVSASPEERGAVLGSSEAAPKAALEMMPFIASPEEYETVLKSDNALPLDGQEGARADLTTQVGIRNYAGLRSLLRTREVALPGMTNLPEPMPSWIASPEGAGAAFRSGNVVPESPKQERLLSASPEEPGAVSGGSETAGKAWPEKLAFSASPEERAAVLKRDDVLPPVGRGEARPVLSSQVEIRNDAGLRSLLRTRDVALPGMTNLPEPTPSWIASPEGAGAAFRSGNVVSESPKQERLLSASPEEPGAVSGGSEAAAKAWPEKLAFSASPEEQAAVLKRDDVLTPVEKGEARADLTTQVGIRNYAGFWSPLQTRNEGQPGMTNLPGPTPSWIAFPEVAGAAFRSGNAVSESPKEERPVSESPEEPGAVSGGSEAAAKAWPEKLAFSASPEEQAAVLKRDDVLTPVEKGEARAVLSSQVEIQNYAGLRSLLLTRDAGLPGITNLPGPTPSWIVFPEVAGAAFRSGNALSESPKQERLLSVSPEEPGAVSGGSEAAVKAWPEKLAFSASPEEQAAVLKRDDVLTPVEKGEARAVLSSQVEIQNYAGLRSLLLTRDAGLPGITNLPGPKSSGVASPEVYGAAVKEEAALVQAAKQQEPVIAAPGEQGADLAKSAEALPQGATGAIANRGEQEKAAANTTGPFLQAEQNNMGIPQGHGAEDGEISASGKPLKQPDAPRELSPRERNILPSEAALSPPGPREAITSRDGTSLENMEAGKKIPSSLPHAELESLRDDASRDKGISINKGKPTIKEIFTPNNQNDLNLTMGNAVVEKEQKIPFFPRESFLEEVAHFLPQAAMKGAGRIKITITPPHLGSLEMEVLVRDNKVQIIMMADSRDVQQTLQVNSEQLKQALHQHGMSVGQFDVLWQGEQSGQRSDSGGGNAFGHNMQRGHDRGDEQENEVAPLVTVSYGASKDLVGGGAGISLFV